jgi:hypothetical protein
VRGAPAPPGCAPRAPPPRGPTRPPLRTAADKACIDQQNISASLACLPVFLSGCRTLLIVPGPTYVHRLWSAPAPAPPRSAPHPPERRLRLTRRCPSLAPGA